MKSGTDLIIDFVTDIGKKIIIFMIWAALITLYLLLPSFASYKIADYFSIPILNEFSFFNFFGLWMMIALVTFTAAKEKKLLISFKHNRIDVKNMYLFYGLMIQSFLFLVLAKLITLIVSYF